MSETPDTIWAQCSAHQNWDDLNASRYKIDWWHEYRRADLPPTLSAALKLPKVKALKDALYECQTALSDFGKAYPHMVKGYMLDAENNAIAALRAIAGGGHE